MKTNQADAVLARLIEKIEQGCSPWKMPWVSSTGSGLPLNPTTGKEYTGLNVLTLWCEQAEYQYSTGLWVGYQQAIAAGGHVRKDETGHTGIRMNAIKKKDEAGNKTDESFLIPTTFKVFNLDQCEGLDHLKPTVESFDWNPHDRAEALLSSSGATIEYGGDRAFYRKATDAIHLPPRERFMSAEGFYATAIHELSHWTGHESRLNRTFGKRFGDNAYAFEELVAELSTAFIQAKIGLEGEVENHASYLSNWLSVLKENPRHLLSAGASASKACEFIVKETT